jgi:hypothetical protein
MINETKKYNMANLTPADLGFLHMAADEMIGYSDDEIIRELKNTAICEDMCDNLEDAETIAYNFYFQKIA